MTDLPIVSLGHFCDVSAALAEIDANPDVWNRHRMRTELYGTPHLAVSDIWVRYNPWENFQGDIAAFNGPHVSEWYPAASQIPSVRRIAEDVFQSVGGRQLGGVLITRIPPGGWVRPHVDSGWHARYYEKFAIQLRGDERQAFHFEAASLSALPGELYTFDNSRLHWVTNDSDSERVTLIICIRREPVDDDPM